MATDKKNTSMLKDHHSGGGGIYNFLAPLFILLTPFISFIRHHEYSYFAPDALLFMAGLSVCAAAIALVIAYGGNIAGALAVGLLVALFSDLQFNLAVKWVLVILCLISVATLLLKANAVRVATIVFATIMVSTLLLPPSPSALQASTTSNYSNDTSESPAIIHLVLDEHIGLEGIPLSVAGGKELKELIRSFYIENDFRLYGNSYSEHFDTKYSLTDLVNFETPEFSPHHLRKRDDSFELTQNDYFDHLANLGYRIHVYQSDYVDYCKDRSVPIAKCHIYKATSIDALQNAPLTTPEKVWLISNVYLQRSKFKALLRSQYSHLREVTARHGRHLPKWTWDRLRVWSLAVMPAMDELQGDLANGTRGSLYFAHLLLPHGPYIYDTECNLRPAKDWENRADFYYTPQNSVETKTMRYIRYFQQIGCTYQKLDQLLITVNGNPEFDDAVVVIHGDHGSRIIATNPLEDYGASYSTLFALRTEHLASDYDRETASIQALFARLVQGEFKSLAAPEPRQTNPFVYIPNPETRELVKHPIKDFMGWSAGG